LSQIDDIFKSVEQRMQKAIEATRNDFASVRTGRASPALLDRLHVEAYGAQVPLKQVATVSTPDARTLQIAAFDRNTIGAIRKAIETSDLGLTPNIDGSNVRLSVPPLTEEFHWSRAATGGLVTAFWLSAPLILLGGSAIKRFGAADEAVGAAILLASDASSYSTGSTIFTEGGRVGTIS